MCCLILRMEHKKEREPVFTYSINWALALPESTNKQKQFTPCAGANTCLDCLDGFEFKFARFK